jgi:hypothetical protein
MRKTVIKALLFIFIGLPGLFIVLFSSFGLGFSAFVEESFKEILLLALLVLVSSLMILAGIQRLTQSGYARIVNFLFVLFHYNIWDHLAKGVISD